MLEFPSYIRTYEQNWIYNYYFYFKNLIKCDEMINVYNLQKFLLIIELCIIIEKIYYKQKLSYDEWDKMLNFLNMEKAYNIIDYFQKQIFNNNLLN